jgi:hypothetical protein
LVGSYLFPSIDFFSSSSSNPEINENTSHYYKLPTASPSSLTITSINSPMSEYTTSSKHNIHHHLHRSVNLKTIHIQPVGDFR